MCATFKNSKLLGLLGATCISNFKHIFSWVIKCLVLCVNHKLKSNKSLLSLKSTPIFECLKLRIENLDCLILIISSFKIFLNDACVGCDGNKP